MPINIDKDTIIRYTIIVYKTIRREVETWKK